MSKRGQSLSMNTIVIAALALIVLVVLIFIFTKQIRSTGEGYINIGDDAKEGLSGTKCESLFSGRYCEGNEGNYDPNKYEPVPVIPPPGGWSDCNGRRCIELIPR